MLRIPLTCATALLLAVGLAACAPEPGTDEATKGGQQSAEEHEGAGGVPDDALKKETELPTDFPSDLFALPTGAVIDDAGARGDGQWFVVLRAKNQRAANVLWDKIIDDNALVASDQQKTGDGGRIATLKNRDAGLTIDALTLPGTGDEVLVSYDLTIAK